MLSGPPQRLIVHLSPAEVLNRIDDHTESEFEPLDSGDLVSRMQANRRKAMDRVRNLHYLARLTENGFEIEATGKQAGQMGMLRGTVTPWQGKSVIDAQFVPNRNVWITYGVAFAVGTFGAIVVVPTIMAIVLGILQYKRLRYSQKVLEPFLAKLFPDAGKPSDSVVDAKIVGQRHTRQASASSAAVPPRVAKETTAPQRLIGSVVPPTAGNTMRTFSDRTGEFRLSAELVEVARGQGPPSVILRDGKGGKHSISLSHLCHADQQWIQHEMRRREQSRVAANKKLAWKRMAIILAVFAGLFLLTFAAMGCVFLIPFVQLFQELQR